MSEVRVRAAGRRPAEARVDLAAIRANYAEARRCAGGREVCAVVKADAYGHGALPVARALVAEGCARLAVLDVCEAARLHDARLGARVLVLGGVHDPAEAAEAVARELVPVLHDAAGLALGAGAARAAGRRTGVEIEVDTGMRRMGVPAASAPDLLAEVAAEPALSLEGTFTHLAQADEADLAPSLAQLALFREVLARALERGVSPGRLHFANSAGLLAGAPLLQALPEADTVRPGLLLYGVPPAAHLRPRLRPAMTLATRVVQVRSVRGGESVGYNARFRARSDTRVATLAIGYADGVPVASSGRGEVSIRGRRFPIAGRVSMDYVGVDVGDAPVVAGDEALLFGVTDGASLPVEEVAAAAGTISYELLVRVGARVPRVYLDRS
ncbi:MAG TPA: alanine racemase [Myxococcota bacterium]|nr:alanine racemase [Myxococcota bacterium]